MNWGPRKPELLGGSEITRFRRSYEERGALVVGALNRKEKKQEEDKRRENRCETAVKSTGKRKKNLSGDSRRFRSGTSKRTPIAKTDESGRGRDHDLLGSGRAQINKEKKVRPERGVPPVLSGSGLKTAGGRKVGPAPITRTCQTARRTAERGRKRPSVIRKKKLGTLLGGCRSLASSTAGASVAHVPA